MHACHSLIDSMLAVTVIACQPIKVLFYIILYLCIIQMCQRCAGKILKVLYLLYIRIANIRCKIEVKSRYCLTAIISF